VNDIRKTGVGEATDEERAANGAETGGTDTRETTVAVESEADPTRRQRDELTRERDEFKDLLLRKTAEFDNYRRRVERERRELREFATADLLRDLLPLVDDLERALAAASDATASQDPADALSGYRAGVELIHRQLMELLRRKGVTPIEAVGADFDPHVHQAVTKEVSPDHREGEVIEDLRRGYKLHDRLLRPAMVKVATRE
jgi:molecular chaperone GrpE